jgi:hypothetical protein
MKKIITIAALFFAYVNATSANPDCAIPTEYVLQFLAKSSSLWKGDQNWLSELISNPQAQVATVFAQIKDNELRNHQGFNARVLHRALKYYKFTDNSGMGATAEFEVIRNDNLVVIKSNIQDMEIQTASTPENAIDLQKKCLAIQKLKPETQKDFSSTCEYHVTGDLENNIKLKVTLNAACTTTMKFDEFLEAVNKINSNK